MKSLALLALLCTIAHADPDQPHHEPDPPRRQWKFLVAEIAGVFAAGQLWYFRNGADGNADDWDMPWSIDAVTAKLSGEAWRYDDNGFVTNSVKHPIIFGAPIHMLARLHGFRFGESFAIATGVSFLWELAGELPEYGSINDILSTSPGGLPIGETLYQIIRHPRRTRFEVRTGLQQLDRTTYEHVGASASVDTLDTQGWFTAGRQARLRGSMPFDADGTRAWELDARTTLGGYRVHDIDEHGDGHTLVAGAFGAFDYIHKMDRADSSYDTFANSLAGPTVAYTVHRGDLHVRGALDLSLDFAMLKPQAFAAWRAVHPGEITRGALEDNRHAYYHSLGTTLEPTVDVAYRGLTAGGRVRASYFNSLDGRDRWAEQMTADIRLEDTRVRASAWVGYEVLGAALTLEAERESRWGRVDEITDRVVHRRLTLSIGYRF